MDAFEVRFLNGDFDKEMQRTTQPVMVGPAWSWVRVEVAKMEARATKMEHVRLEANVEQAVAGIHAGRVEQTAGQSTGSMEASVLDAVKAAGEARRHSLESSLADLVPRAEQYVSELKEEQKMHLATFAANHFKLFDGTKSRKLARSW